MHLELAPDVERTLVEEARVLGLTAAELSARLLVEHAVAWKAERSKGSGERPAISLEEYVAWMKRRSPHFETHDPYAVDWQALKAEGRRF